jgi:hypothetical protein
MGNAGSGTLSVSRGGTGAETFTAGGLLFGNTTSALSQSTGLTWTTATNLLTATNIAGNGSAITSIPYDNLTFKPTAGTGITITAGSSTLSPIISASASSPTSANLITILNATQFTNNTGTNKIDILDTWKPTTSITADRLTTAVNIANVSFDGSSSISLSYRNLDDKPWINPSFSVNNAYMTASRFVKIGGTASEPAYPLDITGDVNTSGVIRYNGVVLGTTSASAFDMSAITTGILSTTKGGTGLTGLAFSRIPYGGNFGVFSTTANLIYNNSCLQVLSGGVTTGSSLYTYFNYQATGLTTTTNAVLQTTNGVSGYFAGPVWTNSRFLVSSDSRIKENIQDINDDTALQMILAIEPKTYNYIDKLSKGYSKVYGFIAQQIRQVIPDAVSIQTDYIPNIMLLADYNDNIITLPSQPTNVIIKLNDKIKCYDKDNRFIKVEVVEIIDELTFRIYIVEEEQRDYNDNKIFVSGTEVDDFHSISKEYIFTLNVCATQELHRRMEAQNIIIISQEDRIKELEAKMSQLLNYISL